MPKSQEETDPQVTYDLLASVVRRIEGQLDDRDVINADLKEIYKEAKGNGLDPKTIRRIVAKRRKDQEKLREEQELEEAYEDALEKAGTNRAAGKAAE